MKNLTVAISVSLIGLTIATPALTQSLDQAARQLISSRLKDPESIVIRNTRTVSATSPDGQPVTVLCGEYNARNGFGGMVGFKPFAYEPKIMNGVVTTNRDMTFEFFSHDPSQDIQANKAAARRFTGNYATWQANLDRAIEFNIAYMPTCLGLQ